MVQGLHGLHQLNIVHRDLRPGNVLLTRDGTCKISHLFVAKVAKSGFLKTRTGNFLSFTDISAFLVVFPSISFGLLRKPMENWEKPMENWEKPMENRENLGKPMEKLGKTREIQKN